MMTRQEKPWVAVAPYDTLLSRAVLTETVDAYDWLIHLMN